MTIIVICPDCGPQEHRGYINPQHVKRGQSVSFRVDKNDDSCPKCGSETVPQAAAESDLALRVRVAATGFFERVNEAIEFRKARKELRTNYRAMRGRTHIRVVPS